MDHYRKPVITTFDQIDTEPGRHSLSTPILFQFSSLKGLQALNHGIFSRRGGISPPPYLALNTSYQTGDRPEYVQSNLELIRHIMGADQLIFSRQVHGRKSLVIDRTRPDQTIGHSEADALITTTPGLGLMITLADCQGAILFDPRLKVLAVVHCGWRGHVKNIYGEVVNRMKNHFHCTPSDIRAGISPSLGPCCAEFKTYRELFPGSFLAFREREAYFNLWDLGQHQLTEAGLELKNIELAGLCTRCRRDLFYSYRGEARTGRFALVALLKHF